MTDTSPQYRIQARLNKLLPSGWIWRIVNADDEVVAQSMALFVCFESEALAKADAEKELARILKGQPSDTDWHDV